MVDTKALEALARVLSLCKQDGYGPYTLLLTSHIAFPSEVRQDICHSTDWKDFQALLAKRGEREKMNILLSSTQKYPLLSGYRALARLAKKGYFAVILTCDPTSQLEEALREADCRFHTLTLSKYNHQQVANALENPPGGVHVLKLHGSLEEGILPEDFLSFWTFPPVVQHALKRHLNREMLVIGSLARDQDVEHLLMRNGNNSLYYVLPEVPDPYDTVVKILEARGLKPDTYVISGAQAEFNTFFGALETLLVSQPEPIVAGSAHARQIGRADVLLVTVNDIETGAVLELFPDKTRLHGLRLIYHDLGLIENARVFLVQQTNQGGHSVGGTQFTVYEGIHELAPKTIIMVGIAYGFDQEKHKVGDILVSQQILDYEQQRVSSGAQNEPTILLRGERPAVSSKLLSRFRSGARDWPEQNVDFGLILSGGKLVDHSGYRDQLRAFAPEALGGEMEGAGLYAATHAHKVDWILAKGISDWADGKKGVNKDQNQLKAARNAARFVIHVLSKGGFTDPAGS